MGSSSILSQTINLHKVFVYGSLMEEEVVRVLLKRVPQSSPAILNNYQRFSIKGRVYPAILPVEDKKITGKVLLGITDPELYILDEFEDVEYERSTVNISLVRAICVEIHSKDPFYLDTSENMEAYAYVWADKTDPNLYGEWDFEYVATTNMIDSQIQTRDFPVWKQTHKNDFVKMTAGFREEFEGPQSKPRVATYESFYHQS